MDSVIIRFFEDASADGTIADLSNTRVHTKGPLAAMAARTGKSSTPSKLFDSIMQFLADESTPAFPAGILPSNLRIGFATVASQIMEAEKAALPEPSQLFKTIMGHLNSRFYTSTNNKAWNARVDEAASASIAYRMTTLPANVDASLPTKYVVNTLSSLAPRQQLTNLSQAQWQQYTDIGRIAYIGWLPRALMPSQNGYGIANTVMQEEPASMQTLSRYMTTWMGDNSDLFIGVQQTQWSKALLTKGLIGYYIKDAPPSASGNKSWQVGVNSEALSVTLANVETTLNNSSLSVDARANQLMTPLYESLEEAATADMTPTAAIQASASSCVDARNIALMIIKGAVTVTMAITFADSQARVAMFMNLITFAHLSNIAVIKRSELTESLISAMYQNALQKATITGLRMYSSAAGVVAEAPADYSARRPAVQLRAHARLQARGISPPAHTPRSASQAGAVQRLTRSLLQGQRTFAAGTGVIASTESQSPLPAAPPQNPTEPSTPDTQLTSTVEVSAPSSPPTTMRTVGARGAGGPINRGARRGRGSRSGRGSTGA